MTLLSAQQSDLLTWADFTLGWFIVLLQLTWPQPTQWIYYIRFMYYKVEKNSSTSFLNNLHNELLYIVFLIVFCISFLPSVMSWRLARVPPSPARLLWSPWDQGDPCSCRYTPEQIPCSSSLLYYMVLLCSIQSIIEAIPQLWQYFLDPYLFALIRNWTQSHNIVN